MAEPASLPLDPAVLESEVFGTIVARLVAGLAALASSPTRTSVAWEGVRVSVELRRRLRDAHGRASYRVAVECEPGRGVGPGDISVFAFILRLFVGGKRAILLPEQVSDVTLATATKQETNVRSYEWRGRFGRAWHRMDVFDPRDTQATPQPLTPNLDPDDATRLMERARRDTRPKSHAGLLPQHAFTTASFTWTPSVGVVLLSPTSVPPNTDQPAPPMNARAVFADTIDAVRRQVECLPTGARVEVTVVDDAAGSQPQRDRPTVFVATREMTPSALPDDGRPDELLIRGVASSMATTSRVSTGGITATVVVRFQKVVTGDTSKTVKVYFYENGTSSLSDAALARGALDWICMSSASVWDNANVPRVFRRAIRDRVDQDGVVSLQFDADTPERPRNAVPETQNQNDAYDFENPRPARVATVSAADLLFTKHTYRISEMVVHLTRDIAFLAPPQPVSEQSVNQDAVDQSPFTFHCDLFVSAAEGNQRPGEQVRAQSKLVLKALDNALWRAKRADRMAFASASEQSKAINASIVADQTLGVLRRGVRGGVLPGTLVMPAMEEEYKKKMIATAFENARYAEED